MSEPRKLLVMGNPQDGFQFAGPFEGDAEDMERWLDDNGWSGGDWWATVLIDPNAKPKSTDAFSEREGRFAASSKSRTYLEDSQRRYDAAVVVWLTQLHESCKDSESYLGDRAAGVAHVLSQEKCLGGNNETIYLAEEDQIDRNGHFILMSTTSAPEPLWALEFGSVAEALAVMDSLRTRVADLQEGWPKEVLPG